MDGLDDELRGLLRAHHFVQRAPARWEFEIAVETHRYLSFWAYPERDRDAYILHAEEWRGGEGYEDEVLRTSSLAEAKAAVATWGRWASEPFVMTRWRRFLNAIGLHFLY